MLFTIQRNIYRSLPHALQLEYIAQQMYIAYPEEPDIAGCQSAVHDIIIATEEWHEKYGSKQPNGLLQCNEDTLVPAWSTPSGYMQYKKTIVCPFDWSHDNLGDFDYTFFLAKIIEEQQ
jgi:hypothetical protein